MRSVFAFMEPDCAIEKKIANNTESLEEQLERNVFWFHLQPILLAVILAIGWLATPRLPAQLNRFHPDDFP